jgi:N utilization substance protein B
MILCSLDLGQDNVELAINKFLVSSLLNEDLAPDERPIVQREVHESEAEFAGDLVRGVMSNLVQIDAEIQAAAHNWTLERMSLVDRNILRLGVFEILFETQTAHRISINEAVEMAKRFGEHTSIKGVKGRYSPQFVNGVLDKIAKKNLDPKEKIDLTRRRKPKA